MEKNKVSIIVPCYNQGQFLEETLDSVLRQTYPNWECIIINDGSIDVTEEVAKKWELKDSRFKYYYTKNSGLCASRNFGITNASGDFILPLDSDDKIGTDYLRLAVASFEQDPSVKVVYCEAKKFGLVDENWVLPPFSLYNLSRTNTIFCSAIFRKSDWEAANGYDMKMIYGWEDWEFWISILKGGGNVKKLDSIQFYYRIRESSMLQTIDPVKSKYLLDYLSVKHADFFIRYYDSFLSMERALQQNTADYENKLKSEKFAIDVFCSALFGFSIFGLYRSTNKK